MIDNDDTAAMTNEELPTGESKPAAEEQSQATLNSQMAATDRTWDLFLVLRQEILEAQKLRAQLLGFKLTFVPTFLALVAGLHEFFQPYTDYLFTIPAFVALSLSLLSESYSFSIHRIGRYMRCVLEPALEDKLSLPETTLKEDTNAEGFAPWQKWLSIDRRTRKKKEWVFYGNFILDLGVVVIAINRLLPLSWISGSLIFSLIVLISCIAYIQLTNHQGDN